MLACIYDVHGNLPALDAVLDDARAAGAQRFLLGGDYAALGGWPAESLARLRELPADAWIRGNWERWAAERPDEVNADWFASSAADAVSAALGADAVAELGALPGTAEVDGLLACHASPGSDMRGFAAGRDPSDAELLNGVRVRRLVFGHTHVQFRRTAGDVDLVNPGSVGLPLDGDRRAAYALVDDGGVELRRVEYDVDASIARVREVGGSWGEVVAGRLERAAA